jgi:hypothetical protein
MAAISTNATPPSNGNQTHFEISGRPSTSEQPTRLNFVSPEYFPALRILMAQGRIWNQAENHNAAPVIVINQTFARRYFPNGDAIGHAIKFPDVRDAPPFNLVAPTANGNLQIVGIIQDKLDDGLANPILPEAFVPYTLGMRMGTQILVRSEASPLTLLHAVSAKVNSIDHDQQTNAGTEDLDHWIQDQPEWARGRMLTWLFGAFAALALAMSAVGLYSVVSYTVAQRTNEFGIRMALGAQRTHVLAIVFRSTVASVGSGVAAGVVLTLALNALIAHGHTDSNYSFNPLVILGATIVLGSVAALACALPARRAAGVDPMKAIRYE